VRARVLFSFFVFVFVLSVFCFLEGLLLVNLVSHICLSTLTSVPPTVAGHLDFISPSHRFPHPQYIKLENAAVREEGVAPAAVEQQNSGNLHRRLLRGGRALADGSTPHNAPHRSEIREPGANQIKGGHGAASGVGKSADAAAPPEKPEKPVQAQGVVEESAAAAAAAAAGADSASGVSGGDDDYLDGIATIKVTDVRQQYGIGDFVATRSSENKNTPEQNAFTCKTGPTGQVVALSKRIPIHKSVVRFACNPNRD
jgi:hypothetical protein